jgi:predicted nuclease with TOPRIM domain
MIDVCDQCRVLQAENAALRRRVVKLESEIKRLRARLKAIREFCERILEATERILSRRSGVPRGKWAYARGAEGVASRVLGMTE